MNDDRWQDTVTRIEDAFKILQHEIIRGDDVSGDREIIEFESPQGRVKLERISKPRVMGKSALSSKRIGGGATVKYEYSATEKIHTVNAYRWDTAANDWTAFNIQGSAS